MIKYIAITMVVTGLWIAFEIWRAPHLDGYGNTIRPTKKLSDLFKKKQKTK